MASGERQGRKRKGSVDYNDVRQHVQVEVGEESLLNNSNVSDLSEELALGEEATSDDEMPIDYFVPVDMLLMTEVNSKKNLVTKCRTFTHIRLEADTDSDTSPQKTQHPSDSKSYKMEGKLKFNLHEPSKDKQFSLHCLILTTQKTDLDMCPILVLIFMAQLNIFT